MAIGNMSIGGDFIPTDLSSVSPPPLDTDEYVTADVGSSAYKRRPLSALWSWIKEKFDNDVIVISKQLQVTTDWIDTGIAGSDLAAGTYAVQMYSEKSPSPPGILGEHFTGIFYWYSGATNSENACEISLHYSGHADNNERLYLRTLRLRNTGDNTNRLHLQIKSTIANTSSDTVYFKFKLLIPA